MQHKLAAEVQAYATLGRPIADRNLHVTAVFLGAGPEDTLERVRNLYDYRRRRFASRLDDHSPEGGLDYEQRAATYRRVMGEIYAAQRATLRQLRDSGEITDEVRRAVEHELDLEQARLERSDAPPAQEPRSATSSA